MGIYMLRNTGSFPVTTPAKVYFAVILCLGAAALSVALQDLHCARPLQFGVYFFLALLSGACKIRLPGMQGTYSMLFLFVLIGVDQFSLAESLALACTASL